ncbi:uncharacterized protein EV420DRAFT_1089956 [Desarmillaria tabescens]|uniref:Uncharacterized protein n=1 Tax=Armillaria tabescens TaxID=1929756 RepID=A0AA39NDH4_ARMTA|nr:uncharacterized protein EV420DRAFT_1089956 [Desarmillaria tabescens]KAK0463463.1 hypothetical protein EV420DRAFT_1089956 [Desarmillaria tabescens]
MYENWVKEKAALRVQELKDTREKRRDAIIKKLEDLGYQHEISRIGVDIFEEHELVKRPAELTDRSWSNIRGELVQWMEETRASTRAHTLAYRQALAAGFLDLFVRSLGSQADTTKFPSVQDFFDFPVVKQILDCPNDYPVSIYTFRDIFPRMPQMLQRWCDNVIFHNQLLGIVGYTGPIFSLDLRHKAPS